MRNFNATFWKATAACTVGALIYVGHGLHQPLSSSFLEATASAQSAPAAARRLERPQYSDFETSAAINAVSPFVMKNLVDERKANGGLFEQGSVASSAGERIGKAARVLLDAFNQGSEGHQ